MSSGNPILRFMNWLWQGLNTLRRVLHLIVLLVIFGVLLAGIAGPTIQMPDGAALIIDPEGELVEQLAGDPLDRAIGELQGLLNAYLLVGDDETVLSVTVWEDNDSLAASRVRATRLRTDAAYEAGATVVSTVEYRVAERAGSLAPIE